MPQGLPVFTFAQRVMKIPYQRPFYDRQDERALLDSLRGGELRRYSGAAELAKRGEVILWEKPRNLSAIAEAIERLMDPATRRVHADKGWKLARELSWDRTAGVVMEALEKSHTECCRC